MQKKKSGVKKCLEILPLRGGVDFLVSINFRSMEETSAGVEINLEGMATFWRNLNLLPRLRTEVSVKLSIHLKLT